jgi:hypothetical protein
MAQEKDVIYRPLDGGTFDKPGPSSSAPVSPLTAKQEKSALTARLQKATAELRDLEELVRSGNLDPRVLSEFRGAVDYIRTTTWAVQQWVGLEQRSGDPYTVLPMLAAERVRRATQLARDLSLDLQAVEVDFETPGLKQLYEAIDDLHRRLAVLCKRKEPT